MIKYAFRIYDQNDKFYDIELKELNGKELQGVDRFIIEIGDYFNLIELLAKKSSIETHQIQRVKIYDKKKDIEFSIVSHNKYLRELLSEMSDDKQSITISPHYVKMREYLLENLQSPNYQDFLDSVYTYKNKFRTLLFKYASVYNQKKYSEEELINENNLMKEVLSKLSSYKNFRGLCICRQKNEDGDYTFSNLSKKTNNIEIKPAVITSSKFNINYDFPTIEEETKDYNYENEEFLEPSEYAMMQGDPTLEAKVKSRVRTFE